MYVLYVQYSTPAEPLPYASPRELELPGIKKAAVLSPPNKAAKMGGCAYGKGDTGETWEGVGCSGRSARPVDNALSLFGNYLSLTPQSNSSHNCRFGG